MVFCDGDRIVVGDLPPPLFLKEETVEEGMGKIDLTKIVSDLERKWILRKLNESDWNKEKAAGLLGVTRKMLNKQNRESTRSNRPSR